MAFYEYDPYNQLNKAIAGDQTLLFSYNGSGQRVSKSVYGETTHYLYEYDKIVLEVDDAGNQKARNVYGTNLLVRDMDGQTLYYMYDGNANVTALLDASTGKVVGTYYYDAWGNIIEKTGDVNNPFAYRGYMYDKETGLYYLNARYYDPKTARFLQEDTVGGNPNDPLSLNLYTYCWNNPLKYTDPTGHWPSGDIWDSFYNRFAEEINRRQEAAWAAFNKSHEAVDYVYSKVDSLAKSTANWGSQIGNQLTNNVAKPIASSLETYVVPPVAKLETWVKPNFTAFEQSVVRPMTTRLDNHVARPLASFADEKAPVISAALEQVLYGNYSKKVTVLGTGVQVVSSLTGADVLADVRDINYDLGNWTWTKSHVGQTALDAVGLIPVIGAVKYSDEAATLLKGSFKSFNPDVFSGFRRNIYSGLPVSSRNLFSNSLSDDLLMWKTGDAYIQGVRKEIGYLYGGLDIGNNGSIINQMNVIKGTGNAAAKAENIYYHSANPDVVNLIKENGFRTDIPSPQQAWNNNRFGRGVYLADSPATALAERPGGAILEVQADIGKNLNVTNRGILDYGMGQLIARGARKHGYDSITFNSAQLDGGINTMVFDPTKVNVR